MSKPYLQSRTIITFTYFPLGSDTSQTVELKGDENITEHLLYLINNTLHTIERELIRARRQPDNDAVVARLTSMLEVERTHSINTLTATFDISRFSASYLLDYATELASVYDDIDLSIQDARCSGE
jgi:hypothetical protein